MALSKSSVILLLANLLIPVAVLVFAIGFFPYKPFLPGLAQYDLDEFPSQPEAPFDKVVFMVVDALRSDFVFAEGTGFTTVQSLIVSGAAVPFTAHATAPTITMPRIKAITTGSTPSFLDLILNFAESDTSSSLAVQDTWLAQMKAKSAGKLVMYGDDTWLKLFPETFDRMDGTSSFFVADFTEVDNNVTRHVPEELLNNDWNTMILHYLGLDHIGHKTGPRSPNMIPKQIEMDTIVKEIFEAIEKREYLNSTLLVLCGDHGMNDAGNHGGSAPGETSPALVFVSPKLKSIFPGRKSPLPVAADFEYYSTIEQSDIAPTLGGLLGFPVPRNNLGAFITDFLPLWPDKNDKIQILLQNAHQVLDIITATFSSALFVDGESTADCSQPFSDIESLACDWISISKQLMLYRMSENSNPKYLLSALSKWSKDAQKIMSSTASNYDMTKLVAGQIVAATGLILSIISAWPTLSAYWLSSLPFAGITILYGLLMFASSYVEEEQHFWYWVTSGWLLFLFAKRTTTTSSRQGKTAFATVCALAALRVIRRWNQTGQKFSGEPDIARNFLTEHNLLLWALIGITYAWNAWKLMYDGFPNLPRANVMPAALILIFFAVSFKAAFTMEDAPELMRGIDPYFLTLTERFDLAAKARIIFICIALLGILAFITLKLANAPTIKFRNASLKTFVALLTTMLLTQTRTSNVPLFLLFSALSSQLKSLEMSAFDTTTTIILLQHVSFFASGGSNAISSIDLSLAYNGVRGFDVMAVGLLTFVGNWAGPIWWASKGAELFSELANGSGDRSSEIDNARISRRQATEPTKVKSQRVQQQHLALLTVFITAHLVFVMAACTALRTHLFIWTVFSPKFLYSMAWSLGLHFMVNIALGSGLFGLARA